MFIFLKNNQEFDIVITSVMKGASGFDPAYEFVIMIEFDLRKCDIRDITSNHFCCLNMQIVNSEPFYQKIYFKILGIESLKKE